MKRESHSLRRIILVVTVIEIYKNINLRPGLVPNLTFSEKNHYFPNSTHTTTNMLQNQKKTFKSFTLCF